MTGTSSTGEDCPKSTYRNFGGPVHICETCPEGAATPGETGGSSIEDCYCGTGEFLQSLSSCESCPANTYRLADAKGGHDKCEKCPVGATSKSRSGTSEDCMCPTGTYFLKSSDLEKGSINEK